MRVSSKLISNQTCDLSSRSIHPHSNLLYEAGNPRTSFLPPRFDRNPISQVLTFESVFPLRLEDTAKLFPGGNPGQSEDDLPRSTHGQFAISFSYDYWAVEGGEERLTLRALGAPSACYYLRQQSRLFHPYQLPFCLAGFFFGLPKVSAFPVQPKAADSEGQDGKNKRCEEEKKGKN